MKFYKVKIASHIVKDITTFITDETGLCLIESDEISRGNELKEVQFVLGTPLTRANCVRVYTSEEKLLKTIVVTALEAEQVSELDKACVSQNGKVYC